jgi:hypothetical protein
MNTLGLKIEFEFSTNLKIKSIDITSNDFLDLIKLNNRYKKKMFSKNVDSLKSKIFKDLKKDISNTNFININGPHYYLSKSIYEYYRSDIKKITNC